jgi:cyclopropane-fatty-acyl-phospholipid synthase
MAKYARNQNPVQVSTEFLNTLFAGHSRPNFQIRMWDHSTWGEAEQQSFTLVLKHPGALREMFLRSSELSLGEAYIFDDFDIEGDIEAAFELADYLLAQQTRSLLQGVYLASLLHKLPRIRQRRDDCRPATLFGVAHSKDRDCQAVRYHYDLPPAFFALFLDQRMVYSCGYFSTPEETSIDQAQLSKLDYICRKLRLRRGDRLLDIGCGWGALLIHAAAHYGVQAWGITLSLPQAEVARRRIQDSGLNDRCRVEVCDYRDLESVQQYDKIVSVGMFEHVGKALLPNYFARVWQLLRPGGVFLNHGIAASATWKRQGPSFADRYVFPDGELVPVSTSLRAAEESGFEIRDVESLREHYALTVHLWLRRLEAHAMEARNITDDTTYRIWRLYIAAGGHRFRSSRLNLYQMLLAKCVHGESGLPLTRSDWYRD